MGQGTLKKGLLPEGGQGSGIRGEFEAPRDRQQREAITTGKVGRGRGRNGCDRSTVRAGAGVKAIWTGGMQLPPETPCQSKELKSLPLGPGTSQLMDSVHRTVNQHLCPTSHWPPDVSDRLTFYKIQCSSLNSGTQTRIFLARKT